MTDISLFNYSLPEELIAQQPAGERDGSRLLVADRAAGKIEHRRFFDLPEYLREGDVLVFNNSRVIKARLVGEKAGTGARVELLLTKQIQASTAGGELFLTNQIQTGTPGGELLLTKQIQTGTAGGELFLTNQIQTGTPGGELWEATARPAKRLRAGDRLLFGEGFSASVETKGEDGLVIVHFECGDFWTCLERFGHTPLPPYIRREDEEEDAERYQTVYAVNPGSAAAPTAGLHFTDGLFERLRRTGAETVFVTLHVGLGTFRPVQTDSIEDHRMHEEYYHIGEDARQRINLAKAEGRRVICVGTTAVRTIESACAADAEGRYFIPGGSRGDSTDIFFYPGGTPFHMTDALITNFHLPRSTLLMLVSAFYDREKVLEIYREAIERRYRFFSYGDAMLIL